MPGLFVLLWSTGFVAAKLGLPYTGPFTYLALRFAAAAALLTVIALAMRAPWPKDRTALVHVAVAGLLLHAVYLGGVFYALSQGVPAGVSALIVGLQPLLVALVASRVAGDRLGASDWVGLLLGLSGVALAVWHKLGSGVGTPAGFAANVAALLGMTAGTLYQKRFGGLADMRTGNAVQFAAAGLAAGLLALATEPLTIRWTGEFVLALAWSVLVLSLGAISLLYLLIRRGSAARVSSLIYLTPPCAALMAWAVFGERMTPLAMAGMVLAVVGVALVYVRRA